MQDLGAGGVEFIGGADILIIIPGCGLVFAVGEREQPTPGNAMFRSGMISGQARDVDEGRTPTFLDVRFAPVGS